MSINIDKRQRADLFRTRLREGLTQQGISQSALARAIGVDRSTVSQLLSGTGARLPNAQLLGECASALGVSADWLLGLADRPETTAHILAHSLSMTDAPRAHADEQIQQWLQEAEGYKIRHVPAGLPDMLKTRAMLEWEYTVPKTRSVDQAIGASEDGRDWLATTQSDYEIALPLFEMHSFIEGTGYYADLPPPVRLEQLDHLLDMTERLYPRLRIALFDARIYFSAPVTVFGPLLGTIYLGQSYLVFRDSERVRTLTDHFDHLVRHARISARDLADHIRAHHRTYGTG